MTDWTGGYVADIGYTYGYYSELNPLRTRLAFLGAGLVFPEIETACELGFGQGVSVNVHAAASDAAWYGTDFNPSQAAFAQSLAKASGSDAHLYDDSFADFARRPDLPDFDYIAVHGIWSWISDENRAVIADFVRRKLKVGGVLYISYNTQPGWAAFAPMRHLMTMHADVMGTAGHGIVSRINGALEFAEKLLATQPNFARANPRVADRLEKLKEQDRNYLAHEYFNRDWHPMHFAACADWLAPAKLQFACSAHYLDHVDPVNLTGDQRNFIKEISDPVLRETVRDFMINQMFRRDYWVKGARRFSNLERMELLRCQTLCLTSYRPDISLDAKGALGTVSLMESVYRPILDLFSSHQPITIGEVEKAMQAREMPFQQMFEALMVLIGMGHLMPVQQAGDAVRTKVARLNAHLIDSSRGSGDLATLASPLTGGGIGVGRFQQLFLAALGRGQTQPTEWAQHAWQTLLAQGHRLARDGIPVESAEESLAELSRQAQEFAEKRLPILRALQVV